MEQVNTIEINGEEREIADAVARGQIDGINSNLNGLGYGENGAKNLFEDEIKWMENIAVTRGTKSVSDGKITLTATSNDCYTNNDVSSWKNNGIKTIPCKPNTTYTFSWECEGDSGGNIYIFENGSTNNMKNTINKAHKLSITTSADAECLTVRIGVSALGASITYWNLQLEEGDAATPYEPYIPSVKMLADEVSAQNESLSVIGKCKNLLNPTLQTTTLNGVTCTNNGDGTYTLNGTATEKADFTIFDNLKKHQHLKNRTVKLVGCPKGGSLTTYRMYLQLQKTPWTSAVDSGEGSSVTVDNNDNWSCWIRIYKDATLSNITFKPMITENLNATYDDFVPYTGDGETLTADVAVLKNDLSECRKKSDITTNETLIGTFNGKNYYRRLFTGIGASGSSITVNVGEKIEIYNYYGRAYAYGQSGASAAKYPIPNKNYYIESQNISETSFQLTIPTSSDTRKIDLVIEYTKVDE